ncbi:MAG TPA: ABC transporter ATP-binding protein [bacterium]|nr:ABC transporter ATP-binding protein [bacterium]
MNASAAIARAVAITRHFVTPDGRLDVLNGIDLEIQPGRIVAIVGASGVGKSTFLHIVGGLDMPSSGKVLWGDRSPYDMGDEERAHYRNRAVGFVFQFHHLLPEFNAEENVALPLIIGGADYRTAVLRARETLAQLGLAERGRHMPGELSGGEQQRAALARALATGAPLIIADEPSGNLDRLTAEQLHSLLGTIVADGTRSVLVATHNPDLAGRADEVYRMRDGRLEPERHGR